MRLKVRFPAVNPEVYEMPATCPHGCGGTYFVRHGQRGQVKQLRDPQYDWVLVYRYRCVNCDHTFRVYPQGVLPGTQQSARLKGLVVTLYALGLSYGAIEDFTTGLGCGIGKTTAYNDVQAAGGVARQQRQQQVQAGGTRPVVGAEATYVQVKGQKVGIEVVVDDSTGELLGLDIITSENSDEILEVIQEVRGQVKGAVLVTADHGAYQEVVDDLGVAHQLCRSHIQRNTDDLADSLSRQLERQEPPPPDTELTPEQLQADLEQLQQLVRERPADGEEQLEQLYDQYKDVPVPAPHTKHSVWYRMRMLVTRLWQRWRKFTLDQRRDDLDGTNNAAERLIGWWIKERYRTMRGYKREESIKNVVTLTALMGAQPGYFDLATLVA